jgi:hypothetical protein
MDIVNQAEQGSSCQTYPQTALCCKKNDLEEAPHAGFAGAASRRVGPLDPPDACAGRTGSGG